MFRIHEITDDLVEDNPTLKDCYLNDNEWDEINIRDLHLIFSMILNILHNKLNSEIQIKHQISQRIYKNLDDYWVIL
ncbi:61_t:CDS:2 [Gigaspora rosea]|nr:61_t:CDS:2 [Gigaspora rosea]